MICPECGHELDSTNTCQNPNCITNVKTEEESDKIVVASDNINHDARNAQINNNTNGNYANQDSSNPNNEFRDENGISPAEMLAFIGEKNPEYYMDKWTRFQDNSKFISWNWPAFLFGIFWFWFRKMYNMVGIIIAINLASTILLFHYGWMRSIVSLTVIICCGLLGNQLYISHAVRKIKSAKFTSGYDNNMLFRRIRSIGGTTWVPVIIAIILFVLFVLLLVIGLFAISSGLSHYIY